MEMRCCRPCRSGRVRPGRPRPEPRRDRPDDRDLDRAGRRQGRRVAALRRLAGDVTFFTAFGDDEVGHRAEQQLREAGVRVECVPRRAAAARLPYVDRTASGAITVIGRKLVPRADDPLPWNDLEEIAGVYLCGADPAAVREARRARVLVATARELSALRAGVGLDALVQSATDESERYQPGDLEPPPRRVVTTEGRRGGRYVEGDREGQWEAAPLPGPLADTYGAGDTFAAALALGLGAGRSTDDALPLPLVPLRRR